MVRLDDMSGGAKVRIGGEWYAVARGHRDLDTGRLDVTLTIPEKAAKGVMAVVLAADRLMISLMGDESEVTLLRGEFGASATTRDHVLRLWMQEPATVR